MKMNSVTDVDFIEQISRASRAGVEVDLLVRGICCIRPGVEGYTDHVRVTSIGFWSIREFFHSEGEAPRSCISVQPI